MSDDHDPLTPEELAAGDGYEPLITDVDCTPRPRFGESLRKFRQRMAVQTVFDDDSGTMHARPMPDPHAEEDARWNRYIVAATKLAYPSYLDPAHVEPSAAGPRVILELGAITILWPKHYSDKGATVLTVSREARVLAYQLGEALAELERRELGR